MVSDTVTRRDHVRKVAEAWRGAERRGTCGWGTAEAPVKAYREQGVALILALVVLLVVSAALALIAAALELRLREIDRRATELRLVALADAALAETLAGLAHSPGFSGLPRRSLPGGWLETEVRPLTSERVRVTTLVHYRGVARAVETDVRLREDQPPRVLAWSSLRTGAGS